MKNTRYLFLVGALVCANATADAQAVQDCISAWNQAHIGTWKASNQYINFDGALGTNTVTYTWKAQAGDAYSIDIKNSTTGETASWVMRSTLGATQSSQPWVAEPEIAYHTVHCTQKDGQFQVVQRYSGTSPTQGAIYDYEDRHITTPTAKVWTVSGRPASSSEPFVPWLVHVATRDNRK